MQNCSSCFYHMVLIFCLGTVNICDFHLRFTRNPYFTFQIYLDSLVITRARAHWNFWRNARGERNLCFFLSSRVSNNESKITMSAPIMPVVQANLVVISKAKKMTSLTTVLNVTRAIKSVVPVKWKFRLWYNVSGLICGEGKRWNEFAEWNVDWPVECYNYAGYNICRMTQRNQFN